MQLEKKFRQVSAFTNRAETKLTPPLAVPSDLTAEQTVPSDSGFPPPKRAGCLWGLGKESFSTRPRFQMAVRNC